MKPLEESTTNLVLIGADLKLLTPRAVHSEVIYMRGSRIKAWSASEAPAAGSDEPPMLLPDKLDRWIAGREKSYHAAIARMRSAQEEALHIQRQLLARLSQEEARELAEAEAEAGGGTCVVCKRFVDKAKGERLLAGRCYADYEYRRRHDGQDAPQAVLDARLEAEVQAQTTRRVKGGRRAAA